jgi:hypothetical protein
MIVPQSRSATLFAVAIVLTLLSNACDRRTVVGPGPLPSNIRPPTFDYQKTDGCGRFTVYRTNADQSEAFIVHADLDALAKDQLDRDLDLAVHLKTITVTVDMFPRPQKHLHLCTDFTHPDSDPPTTWTAFRGKVRIERFAPEKKKEVGPSTFRVKVTVTDAEFRSPEGHEGKCPHPIVLDAVVGWFAG